MYWSALQHVAYVRYYTGIMPPTDPQRITFQEEEFQYPNANARQASGMVRWIYTHSGGLLKNERQATYVLVITVGILLLISVLILINSAPEVVPVNPPSAI